MCTVSMVTGWGQQIYPSPANPPDIFWWESFRKLAEAAKQFDKETGQPDCVDPVKDDWMKSMEERMERIEQLLFAKQ